MFFESIASKNGKKESANHDSFNELQNYADRKIGQGFINLEVRAYKNNRLFKICEYVEEVGAWEKVRETTK